MYSVREYLQDTVVYTPGVALEHVFLINGFI
jgi:hypothetical protein